jgi:hypothetical protein
VNVKTEEQWLAEAQAEERRVMRRQHTTEVMDPILREVNSMGGGVSPDDIADYLMHEHPTLTGQLAKGVALGIMRHATRNPEWRPGDRWTTDCPIGGEPHPIHDGRIDCRTVIGADLMARQSFI